MTGEAPAQPTRKPARKSIRTARRAPEALPLYRQLKEVPRLADAGKARARVNELLGSDAAAGLRPLADEPRVKALLEALADHSPFLWRLASADPARLARCLSSDPQARLAACLADMTAACDAASDRARRHANPAHRAAGDRAAHRAR